jgi:hypothetical protein
MLRSALTLFVALAVVAGAYAHTAIRPVEPPSPPLVLHELPLIDPAASPAAQRETIRRTAELLEADDLAARLWLTGAGRR